MTGKVFGGRYEIGERIGIGGMAEVYSATDNVLGRIVAVKVMLPQYAEDPDFARRFRQEAAAAANLSSPYIVNVYDWGHDDDTYYIVMEYIRGIDLKTAIIQRGALNQRKVAEIGMQVCSALSVAHNQDIIHRDIKPQNIMIQPDGNVKVMDFGIARAKNSTTDKTQTVLGTAHYTSPEQAQGKDLTATSDIYSLGIVLYEAATGTLPFDGPDAVSVALMQVQNFPTPPHEINPDIDPELETIIMTAINKDPLRRFATANEMKVALGNYLAGRPINAPAGATVPLNDGFTSAQTSVIAPIGPGAIDETQVMPVTRQNAASHAKNGSQYRTRTAGNEAEIAAKKKKRNIIIAVVAVIAIAAIAAGVFLFSGGEKAQVPDVVGKTSEEATQTIESAGFSVGKIESVYDAEVEPGHVISQDPGAGMMAAKGSRVNLIISQGSENIAIPDVLNKSQSEAVRLLTSSGFVVGDVTTEKSDEVEAGNVIRQSPAAGEQAPKGSTVNLVISEGTDEVDVPDLTGLSVETARSRAEKAGFSISESSSEYSSVDKGCIIRQSPAAGSKLPKGSTITYVVSKGKEDTSTTVPGVLGESAQSARNILGNAGFGVEVKTVDVSDPSEDGVVIDQSPRGSSKANAGSTVTITVGHYVASSE